MLQSLREATVGATRLGLGPRLELRRSDADRDRDVLRVPIPAAGTFAMQGC